MILCLDVGNTQIHAGVFEGNKLRAQFRKGTLPAPSSDEIGIFLKMALRENDVDPQQLTRIAVCSVVPDLDHSIGSACIKYFQKTPFFLEAGVKTGLKIRYKNPVEVGADRIANSIAATRLFPNRNAIVVDLGTATTFCVITAERDYLGGLILPGLRISMEALGTRTAKLPRVEIAPPESLVGRSTTESIQAGLYYSHLAAVSDISRRIREDVLRDPKALLIGTGGFSRLFEKEAKFDHWIPELVLVGLRDALDLNPEEGVSA